jgi:hypothetical protein
MNNSNVPVKSRGAVVFANNTPTVDYEKIAEQAARLIKHTLALPVTIIRNTSLHENYRTGYAHGTVWNNLDRCQAYGSSPYDETLLLDSDYIVLDDSLLKILDTVDDYKIITSNQSPKQSMDGNMGLLSLNYVWATAVAFKKTAKTNMLFDLVGRVQRNYNYYRKLYNIRERNFRNDYAFAIADNIINGYTPSHGIPWTMLTIDKPIKKLEIKDNIITVREEESAHVIPKQSIHVMDKDYLQSDDYIKFVDAICQTN